VKSNEDEKAGTAMQLKNETRTGLATEIKVVPAWAWALAGIIFVAAQFFFNVVVARHSGGPPAWCRPVLGTLAGVGGGCLFLLIGYINRDAKRRGMSPTLWTIVAILIPNGLGFLLYFILRQPRSNACPQCGNAVHTGFNFCPRCNHKLSPSCPLCQRVAGVNDVYCPYCGTSLHSQAVPGSSSPETT
jgi:RNA polymerase subunit RPABC4/transcription elongation factor Spt4